MDYKNQILSFDFLQNDLELCYEIVNEYNKQKEINCSWYGPKKPFIVTMPKLIDNAATAKKVLKLQLLCHHDFQICFGAGFVCIKCGQQG